MLDPAEKLTTIKGTVEAIVFQNESNGYTVCEINSDPDFMAVGSMPDLTAGDSVELCGEWVDHPVHGRQFKVVQYWQVQPDTEDAIYKYLCSGLIKGVGPRTAARLISLFGAETLDVMRRQPEKVGRVKGIGQAKAERFAAQLREKQEFQDLVLLLAPHGIGTGLVYRIYRQWGADSIRRIHLNPYALADEIDGIGFLTADRLARSLGVDPAAPERLASALHYQMTQSIYQGHTWLPLPQLIEQASVLIGCPPADVQTLIPSLLAAGQLIVFGKEFGDQENQRIALPAYFQIERMAARRLQTLLKTAPTRFVEWLEPAEAQLVLVASSRKFDLELAEEQADALILALQHPLVILTGGPGTGKTTIIRLLADCFQSHGGRVLLAAPTGRAARRLAEMTGCPAQTLHRLLALPFGGDRDPVLTYFAQTAEVDLACDLLVVDEVSMMDIILLKSLVDAVQPGTRVVLVGDADQLPAIGPGLVLQDLLNCGQIPVARLQYIFRQSAQSLIIRNAHRLLHGQWFEIDQSFASQFLLIAKDQVEAMADAVVKLCTDILPRQYGFDPIRDVQVLTPAHKGPAGTQALNRALQQALVGRGSLEPGQTATAAEMPVVSRPQPGLDAPTLQAHGVTFAVGDKVMQLRNQYELAWTIVDDPQAQGSGVFNGESGLVSAVDEEDDQLTVLFDDGRQVDYDRGALEDLDLAYAITVHKSQGSEYPVVILVVPPTAPRLLTRNLLYTAITRARQKLLLVSSRRILTGMIANQQTNHRCTLLRQWLQNGQTGQEASPWNDRHINQIAISDE